MQIKQHIQFLLFIVGLSAAVIQAAPLYYISGQVQANAFPDDINNLPRTQSLVEVTSLADSMLATSSLGNYGLARYEANHTSAVVRAEVFAQNAQRSETEYDWANAEGYVHLVDTLTFTIPAGTYADGVEVTASGYYSLYLEATGRGQARGSFLASLGDVSLGTGPLQVDGFGGIDTLSLAEPFALTLPLIVPGTTLLDPLQVSHSIALSYGLTTSLVAGTQGSPALPMSASGWFDGFKGAYFTSLALNDGNVTWDSASGVFLSDPIPPAIALAKQTNGNQADAPNGGDVPRIAPGEAVTWTYEVTNIGGITLAFDEVSVSDSQPGVVPVLDPASDDGDLLLSPGESWVYTASAQALDLTSPPPAVTVVPGCGDSRNTYQNTGRADITGSTFFAEDPSHYCNPSEEDSDADGTLNDFDNCIFDPNGPLIPDAGGNIQRDTDADGYGNLCDPDFNNDLFVNAADLAYMKEHFFSADADADLNGDLLVNATDLARLKTLFFQAPGPSCCGTP